MRERGLFIVFEGIDGAGTGTQIRLLKEKLEGTGYIVHDEEEPSEYRLPFGKQADDVLKKIIPHPGNKELQVLMVNDRAEHVKQIQSWLALGHIVICSRYLYSTLVYGQASEVPYDELWEMNKNFPRPNVAFYLDITADESIRRINKRHIDEGAPLEIFEVSEFQKEVRRLFLDMVGNLKFPELRLINGSLRPKAVHERVMGLVRPLLTLSRP